MSAKPRNEEEIFFQALEIADPAERAAYLAGLPDDATRAAVQSMLADHESADALLDSCADAMIWSDELAQKAVDAASHENSVGDRIGRYSLTRFLGEGGSGIVYEAEQTAPVRRSVALKILKPGMDTSRVIQRFEAERQTLALMEHPNIARVIDAGATASGRPYFVMERVTGDRITDYCERSNASLPDRLRLAQDVCSAIQHAHQKGIIHLDLKPSNILVSLIDDRPVPKVIDFGVARAVADQPTDSGSEPLAGTPAYMSPEQRQGDGQSDTRSDIYSLGLVLRELIRDAAPQTRNASRLPGDLDSIVRKATRADPADRYQTIRSLEQDLENYLANRPVEARPATTLYRFGKLVQRNKLATAAIAFAAVALLGGFATSTALLVRARAAERQESQLRAEAEERARVAKAAILLMQDKPAEANRAIEQMGGVLTQPSVEATKVFRDLAVWSALRRDWKTAGQRLLALSRVNRFDDSDQSDNATRDLVPIAPTLVAAGEIAAYRDFHQRLLERLGDTRNPVAAEQILKGCVLLPESPETLARLQPLVDVAEQSLASMPDSGPKDHLDAWRCAVLGLWQYRIGEYKRAIVWADRSIAFRDDELSRRAYSLVTRGMALAALGQRQPAAADFAQARQLLATNFSDTPDFNRHGFWNDWLSARLLLQQSDPQ